MDYFIDDMSLSSTKLFLELFNMETDENENIIEDIT